MLASTVRTGSLALTLCLVCGVYGQAGDKPLTFDVASLKPVAPLTSVPDGGDGGGHEKEGRRNSGGGGSRHQRSWPDPLSPHSALECALLVQESL